MTALTVPQAVLAETISRDQLNQLAAVMLGLVVFASIFALIERQRSRRGKHGDDVAEPPLDQPPSAPPPRYVSDAPAVAITTAPRSPATPDAAPDNLPVPFVPRAQEPAVDSSPAPVVMPPGPTVTPQPSGPRQESVPPEQPVQPASEPAPPASPDEIGIILPDEPSAPANGGAPPRP
jgi:hypothetical protein